MVDLCLVVGRAKARPAVVAQRQASGDRPLDRAEALDGHLPQQVGGRPAVHPQRRVAEDLARGVIDDAKIAERPSLLQPSVASVAHSVSGTVTVARLPQLAGTRGRS